MTTAGERGPIFLGGCPRSGLTLLRVMLDSHPQISCGPDSGVVSLAQAARNIGTTLGALHARDFLLPPEQVRANFARAIGAILNARRDALQRSLAAEKSPMNVLFFEDYAAMFPSARFLHVVRDGRDVAASLVGRGWKDPRTGRLFDYCASPEGAIRYWKGLAAAGLAAERALGGRLLRVRYEDLVRDPEKALRAACAFLNIPYTVQFLLFFERPADLAGMELESAAGFKAPVHGGQIGRSRTELPPAALRHIESVAANELRALGYA
jgi:hypothetical protein